MVWDRSGCSGFTGFGVLAFGRSLPVARWQKTANKGHWTKSAFGPECVKTGQCNVGT